MVVCDSAYHTCCRILCVGCKRNLVGAANIFPCLHRGWVQPSDKGCYSPRGPNHWGVIRPELKPLQVRREGHRTVSDGPKSLCGIGKRWPSWSLRNRHLDRVIVDNLISRCGFWGWIRPVLTTGQVVPSSRARVVVAGESVPLGCLFLVSPVSTGTRIATGMYPSVNCIELHPLNVRVLSRLARAC